MKNAKRLILRAVLLALVLAALSAAALAANYTADTPASFYGAMRQAMSGFQTEFSIVYTGDASTQPGGSKPELAYLLRDLCAVSDDAADNNDFLALNVSDGSVRTRGSTVTFSLSYLSSAAQLAEVDTRAAAIVKDLALSKEDDFTKIKLVYEYVCTHFTYDNTLKKFTAYEGLTTGSMVCQGYALLTERLLWDAGVPCRVVTGVSADQNHAWNIAKLNGKWYYLDTTWDAAQTAGGVMSWDFFLKGEDDFTGHTSFEAYTTDPFLSAHPLADKSASLPRLSVLANGSPATSLAVRTGVQVQLVAQYADGSEASGVVWTSADPSLLEVSADGVLTPKATGSVRISAAVAGNRGVIGAEIPAAVVDLRAASPWAFDDVTAYYLHQLLPVSLCSDFQSGVTRAEFARMVYQFVLVTHGWSNVRASLDFTDISDSEDGLYILMCKGAGLFEGTSKTTFSPDRIVTREEAAAVLVRLAGYLDGKDCTGSGSLSYADGASVSAWAREYVSAATDAGILRGAAGSFRPSAPMTREQLAVAMERMYDARADQFRKKAA
jgi:hypothetical protein